MSRNSANSWENHFFFRILAIYLVQVLDSKIDQNGHLGKNQFLNDHQPQTSDAKKGLPKRPNLSDKSCEPWFRQISF